MPARFRRRRLNAMTDANATTSTARELARFALSGLAALILLAVVGAFVLRDRGRAEAVRDARGVAELAGRGIVAPALEPGVLRGDPQAIARLDRIVRSRVLTGRTVRVKMWDATGRIVYSDEPRLRGARYRLQTDEQAVLRRGAVEAEISDLTRPENRFERPSGKLLEVYLGIQGPHGRPLLYEQYLRFSSVEASGRRIWMAFLPALLGALLVLELVQLPLARSLVRKVRVALRDREALLLRAVDASQTERRRVARDLHDGPVQDLAGVSFSLAAAAERLRTSAPEAAEELTRAASATRASMRRLRSLLVEIYPTSLARSGLAAVLDDVVAPARARGMDVELDVLDGPRPPLEIETLLFRAAQEAVRNAVTHADARRLEVEVVRRDGHIRLRVADDGRGIDAERAARKREAGHLGLSLIADLAREAGGTVEVGGRAGGGTEVLVEVPA